MTQKQAATEDGCSEGQAEQRQHLAMPVACVLKEVLTEKDFHFYAKNNPYNKSHAGLSAYLWAS